MALTDKLTAIADAVRAKTGGAERLTLDQIAAAISGISGGGTVETGEFIGDGTYNVYIPLGFEPDIVYVRLTNDSEIYDSNHIYCVALIRDICYVATHRAANSATVSNGGYGINVTGLYASASVYAEYADGTLHCYFSPASRKFYNGAAYTWIARKW